MLEIPINKPFCFKKNADFSGNLVQICLQWKNEGEQASMCIIQPCKNKFMPQALVKAFISGTNWGFFSASYAHFFFLADFITLRSQILS